MIGIIKNRRLLVLEGYYFRFGWHGHMWYNKLKSNVEFKNHYVRYALCICIKIFRFYGKIPLLISQHEAYFSGDTSSEKAGCYKGIY